MKLQRVLLALPLALVLAPMAKAQYFINGDLEGPSPTSLSIIAPSWQHVPDDDPVCLATDGSAGDTPDLSDVNGPSAFTGVFGNAYSGSTYMSGCRSDDGDPTWIFQEGIMQQVMGFVPGNTYTIVLHQAVDASYGCYDPSGSWAVYIDNSLAGITEPTTCAVPYDTWPFIWEERSVAFAASMTYHTIKFLPHDDDMDLMTSAPNGALRMAIDMISLLQGNHTGIADNGLGIDGILAPNPFTDQLTIATSSGSAKGALSLHAMTGELVYANSFWSLDHRARIDLSEIKPGPYVVRIAVDGMDYRQFVLKE